MKPESFESAAGALSAAAYGSPVVRAVNFHNTPRHREAELERQIARLGREFSSVNEEELDAFLATGRWAKPKPGVIIAVYEGYRNGYDVLRPILERHGLVGWFFVITGFVNEPVSSQFAFAASHDIDMETREYDDGRYAMTWEEIRELSVRHVIASHTRTHVSLATLTAGDRESEVVGAQQDFMRHLGRRVRSFVSLGGPEYGNDDATDRLIDLAGYQLVFSNLRVQRLRPWHGA